MACPSAGSEAELTTEESVNPMRRSITIGIDPSSEAIAAARVGASFARRLDRNLVLARVVAEPPAPPCGNRLTSAALRRRAIQSATDLLKSVATEIGEEGARKRVSLFGPAEESPEDGFARLLREEDSDLLVVGADARGELPHALAGSRSASLLRSCPCPLMVVPAGSTNPFAARRLAAPGPIVCGIDWSVSSDRARLVAEGVSGRLGLPVLPIYVDQIGPWKENLGGVQVEVGDPATALVRAAARHRASLIVVGIGAHETLSGSVGRGLAATAPVPVLIVSPGSRLPHFRTAADIELVRAAELVQAA